MKKSIEIACSLLKLKFQNLPKKLFFYLFSVFFFPILTALELSNKHSKDIHDSNIFLEASIKRPFSVSYRILSFVSLPTTTFCNIPQKTQVISIGTGIPPWTKLGFQQHLQRTSSFVVHPIFSTLETPNNAKTILTIRQFLILRHHYNHLSLNYIQALLTH